MQANDDGTWRWDPSSAKRGEVTLTPTYRLVQPYTVVESEGTTVFVDCIDGSLLCKHGELGTTIGTWIQLERVAKREGKMPPPRRSMCDCTSASGLGKKIDPPPAHLAQTSLFDHLCSMGTKSILVGGKEARQLPYIGDGKEAAFLTPTGHIVCRHGLLRSSLLRMERRGMRRRCDCMPRGVPNRASLGRQTNVREPRAGKCCPAVQLVPEDDDSDDDDDHQ